MDKNNEKMLAVISEMEERFDHGSELVARCERALDEYLAYRCELKSLFEYYGSEEWFAAYDAEREGKLGRKLKCGVLDQDSVYELLCDDRRLGELICRASNTLRSEKMTYDIIFLGTCACDYSPRLRGDCADRFDDNARRASCLLFNEHFLIDCGPHCLDSLRIAEIDCAKITDLFITHLHSDHYCPENIAAIANAADRPLRVWLSEDAEPSIPSPNVELMPMKKFTRYAVDGRLSVVGLSANHDRAAHPQHLLFELDGKRFMYGCDGAWLQNDTCEYLKKAPLSLIVLDGTCGETVGEYRIAEHNTIPMLRLMLPSMKTLGILDDSTGVCISHIAPSLHRPHAEIVETLKGDGILVAYDGMKLEI